MTSRSSQPLLLFDGVCNLCNAAVTFVLDRDSTNRFQFASLQSQTGQEILRQLGRPTDQFSSFVLWENGRFYEQSTAALRVACHLSGGWPLLYSFIIVPKGIRDAVYDFVARNRYRWFGQRDACMLPTPELKARFLT
ncbi:thiol-disulfide oxidoreductase DCC family protein [Spirosoma sp. RP8]|uniref:Thiol-disulfide oxidoreductase DCC family protein n=1 Tax=Spirosoma liriopis TaxID=2937440 RepID=A0ABT0HGQ7_9BACT|nr:thiol-disulfide oxidoreductase DCC family protein [Spirosoma liriopis]MCK8491328.1 thiol-disulfide oxidoreductase DCC family protein [Spirosoma liriopis]